MNFEMKQIRPNEIDIVDSDGFPIVQMIGFESGVRRYSFGNDSWIPCSGRIGKSRIKGILGQIKTEAKRRSEEYAKLAEFCDQQISES